MYIIYVYMNINIYNLYIFYIYILHMYSYYVFMCNVIDLCEGI